MQESTDGYIMDIAIQHDSVYSSTVDTALQPYCGYSSTSLLWIQLYSLIVDCGYSSTAYSLLWIQLYSLTALQYGGGYPIAHIVELCNKHTV